MKKVVITGLLVAVLLLVMVMPAQAAVVQNVKVPISEVVWVPCAAGGAGEWVQLQGNLHTLMTLTNDSNVFYRKTLVTNIM